MKGSSYKMGGTKTKDTMAYMKKSPLEAAKPDFPDIDGDGNTTESMKQAAADKKGSMNKMKSPLEAMGGKFKFDDSGEYPTKTQISDQEYAEILAKEAELEKQSDALIAERDANMNTNSYAIYDKKSEELYKDNPIPRTGTEGLDYTTGKYKSLAEAQEALSTMDPKSEEYNDLANTIHFELGDRGKKMTAEQRRLSMDKS